MAARPRPRVGFVLERALGHVTHAENLKRLLPNETSIDARIHEIAWECNGWSAHAPGFRSNWTIRSGVRARRGIRRLQPLDALFIHTQVPAVLAPDWLTRIPTVISIDATPLQYDQLGEHYDHASSNRYIERLKWRANRICFERATHLVSWSEWAKQGLVDGYGVDPMKITVIPPGVTSSTWTSPARRSSHRGPIRILFVGGDLRRKGGDVLMRAFHQLRSEPETMAAASGLELHLVTRDDVAPAPGLIVHHGLQPGDRALVELYQRADVFCLPTRGDCLPMVLSEAGAAALPLVSTAIAGIPEIVREGETGFTVPPGDEAGLIVALRTLVVAPNLRVRLGAAARRVVERDFDAEQNTHRLVALLSAVATGEVGRPFAHPVPVAR